MTNLPPEALDLLEKLEPESRARVLRFVEEMGRMLDSAKETLSAEDYERFVEEGLKEIKRQQVGISLPAERHPFFREA